MNEKNYFAFRQGFINCIIFSAVYVLCMYHNPSAVTFPVLMGVGVWFLFAMRSLKPETEEKPVHKKQLIMTAVLLGVLSFSVPFTDNGVMIFIAKCLCVVLYFYLAIELYLPYESWTDIRFLQSEGFLFWGSLWGFIPLFSDFFEAGEVKRQAVKQRELMEQNGQTEKTQKRKKIVLPQNTKYVIRGVLLSAALLCVILPIMMSADVVFKDFLNRLFNFDWIWRVLDSEWIIVLFRNFNGILWSFLIALCLYYGFVRRIILKPDGVLIGEREHKYGNTITGITVLSVIAFVYIVFGCFQLFGILNSNVSLPEGYTYAQYAREGFFQLFALALINMLIVLISLSRYEKSKIVKTLLYVMCGCTYAMIFASAYKMCLYISIYNLTFLRFMVLWALVVIAQMMAAVICYITLGNFSLFKTGLMLVTAGFVIAMLLRPDYHIANYNLNYGNQETVDYYYLCRTLSMDAYPVVVRAYARGVKQSGRTEETMKGYYEALDDGTMEAYEEFLTEVLKDKYGREKGFSLRKLNFSREYVAARLKLTAKGKNR